MVACSSVGYFTPSAMRPSSCFRFLSFISLLCHPFSPPPSPAPLHYPNTHLLVFFFFFCPPPDYTQAFSLLQAKILSS
jgi:hypothetical protein